MTVSPTSSQEITRRIGAASGLVEIAGNDIYYEVAGEGLPIVFLHDGLIHRVGFDHQWAAFSQNFTVIRYDRPGYGDSRPPKVAYSHVGTLKGLLDLMGLEWNDLWRDYRLSAIGYLLYPAWQWAAGLPDFIWWHHAERTILAFQELECEDLLGEQP